MPLQNDSKLTCRSISLGAAPTSFSKLAVRPGEEECCLQAPVELDEVFAHIVLSDGNVMSILAGVGCAVKEALENQQSGEQALLRFRPASLALHLAQIVEHAGPHAEPLRCLDLPVLDFECRQSPLIQLLGLIDMPDGGQDGAEVSHTFGLPDPVVNVFGIRRDEPLINREHRAVGLLGVGLFHPFLRKAQAHKIGRQQTCA